jgi:hypothetical protein
MSTFTDKQLKCIECNQDFTYTVAEQELHQSLGYQNEPKRSTPCARGEAAASEGGGGGPRAGGTAAGAAAAARDSSRRLRRCGKEAQLPFKPRATAGSTAATCFRRTTPM